MNIHMALSTKHHAPRTERGYAAIVAVIVVGAVLVLTGVGVVLNSINEVQSSFGEGQKEIGLALVDACAQESLLRINKNNALPGTITLPQGSCTVTINSQVGNSWDFTISGTFGVYSKSVRVTATRTSSVVVNSWQEI
jgi:hypothetical protein